MAAQVIHSGSAESSALDGRDPKVLHRSLMQSFFRRALTVTVVGACVAGAGYLSAPTAVAAINQAALAASAQSFEMPFSALTVKPRADLAAAATAATPSSTSLVPPPVRDDFVVELFSLVQWPVAEGSPIASYFGPRSCAGCSSNHMGLDFTPGAGYPIQAVADGVVVTAQQSGEFGVHVTIRHSIDGVVFTTTYAHMQVGSMTVSPGQEVERGTVLGGVGATGNSTGNHLHFEVANAAGTPINPLSWLRQYANIAYGS